MTTKPQIDRSGPLRVYYNSACPVCKAGINTQQDKMQQCDIAWIDIHQQIEARKDLAADTESVRKRLHVVDETGKLHVGISAFIVLWSNSAGEEWKAKCLSLPILHSLAAGAYNGFAWTLYCWNRFKKHW